MLTLRSQSRILPGSKSSPFASLTFSGRNRLDYGPSEHVNRELLGP